VLHSAVTTVIKCGGCGMEMVGDRRD